MTSDFGRDAEALSVSSLHRFYDRLPAAYRRLSFHALSDAFIACPKRMIDFKRDEIIIE
jgi:hypothetical protein